MYNMPKIKWKECEKMKVKECMCGDVCCVKPETKLTEVAKLMEKNRIGCVPVCDSSNYLVGVITDRDYIKKFSMWQTSTKYNCKWNNDMQCLHM